MVVLLDPAARDHSVGTISTLNLPVHWKVKVVLAIVAIGPS